MSSADLELPNFQFKINIIMKKKFDNTENEALNKTDVMRRYYDKNEFIFNLLFSSLFLIYVNMGFPVQVVKMVSRHYKYVVYV